MSSLKVVTCNIEGNRHLPEVISFLQSERPDVVCLQEVLGSNVERLKNELSMNGEFIPCLKIDQENFVGFPVGETWGVMVLTNLLEFSISTNPYVTNGESIPEFGYKNPNAANRVLEIIEVKKEDVLFRVITTHFTWTPDGKSSELQRDNLQKMLAILKQYDEFVLCGDFNAPRGGEIWEMIASAYKDNIPLDALSTIDPNLHRVKDIQLVVDGVFSTSSYTVSDVRLHEGVSDHKAVVATINK